MDLHHLKSPLPLSTSRTTSATFPLTHGSPALRSNGQPIPNAPFAARNESATDRSSSGSPYRQNHDCDNTISFDDPLVHARPRPFAKQADLPSLDGVKSHHRHKHSKSRELRLPRPMSHLASSASARGLLPTWSGGRDREREREREREIDDGLLRPITRETTRSRWGSDSTSGLSSGSRRGSLLDAPEQHERLGPIRRQDIKSMEDLEEVTRRRKQGEEYLRSALTSIGTLATDVTRRLDYTYYNLLEKITALASTISSFQELSDSASTLLNDFERETSNLDQEIRKQIDDLKGFQPQIEKADALEERMMKGRKRVEELGKRLEAVQSQIDSWEAREAEWQTRISRRLRIFWGVVGSALAVLVLALILQKWPTPSTSDQGEVLASTGLAKLANQSLSSSANAPDTWSSVFSVHEPAAISGSSRYPSNLAERRQSLEHEQAASSAVVSSSSQTENDGVPSHDPFRLLDEL